MEFRSCVFEKLLFPVNKNIYKSIQQCIEEVELLHPGKIEQIINDYQNSFSNDSSTEEWRPGDGNVVKYPSINIAIQFNPQKEYRISSLKKDNEFKISFDYNETLAKDYSGSHLLIGFYRNKVLHSFAVPLQFLLGFHEKLIMKEGSYQLYSHSIIPKEITHTVNSALENQNQISRPNPRFQELYRQASYTYIGITKRTWQQRMKEHIYAANSGSQLRFHRALRGELFNIGTIEHSVEKAGLDENQALNLEEIEVEKRTFHPVHDQGLNMIPGGKAGLAFISNWAHRTEYKFKKKLTSDTAEDTFVDIHKNNLKSLINNKRKNITNEKLRKLWAENINFRIDATTNQKNRFSYKQIQTARILYASNWDRDKIFQTITKIDTKNIKIDQLDKLLDGITYQDIPDVII